MISYAVRSYCWLSNVNLCQLSRRNYFNPVNHNILLGFRLTKTLKV